MGVIFKFILVIFVAWGCANQNPQDKSVIDKKKLLQETQSLKTLQDSFNRTGDYNYIRKYLIKNDSLIRKYPSYKGFVQTKEMMLEMFGDSLYKVENAKRQNENKKN